jgi:hypothetical protein
MNKFRSVIAIGVIAAIGAMFCASANAQQCNVPQQNSVSSAAVLQTQAANLAAQQLLSAQANRQATSTATASTSRVVAAPSTIIVPPPQIVQAQPQLFLQAQPQLLAVAPGTVATATSSGGGGSSRTRSGIRLLPPVSRSGTRRNGSTFAFSRG